jgi:DNA-binding SARP family transcriptional activator
VRRHNRTAPPITPEAPTFDAGSTDLRPLRAVLLGGFAIGVGDGPLAAFGTPRIQSLLAYLLLHRQTPQSRQHLAFMLWPDSTETQARANLRNLVHGLQHGLPHVGKRLEMGTGTLGWRHDATMEVDVADFEAAVNAADTARRSADTTGAQAQLEAAVSIYRGELLPGFYDDWIVTERDRLDSLARHALDVLVDLLEAQRDYARAIVHAERLLQQDRLNETTYRRLMRLHVLSGDHAGARRVYQACVDVLRRELGEEPGGATREAYAVAQREVEDPRPAGDQPSRWPLVGRQPEWASVRKYFQAGNSGTRLLLIVGEAGVGKTRLTEELVEWRRGHGDFTAVAGCYRGGVISYAPVAAWLRTPGVEAARAGLQDLWLGEVGRIVPELLAERPDLTPRPITEDWQRQHLFEALARALVAPGQPMFVVLEDLHWCDQATLEFLGFFLRWHSPSE